MVVLYQLRITLQDTEPPIWRLVQVSPDISLGHLHQIFQCVMGWKDSHLHQFEHKGYEYGLPDRECQSDSTIEEGDVALSALLKAEGDSLVYVYDFGDNWRHDVVLEKILPSRNVVEHVTCLDGDRHCPPEDVGGVHAYEEFLRVISYRYMDEYRSLRAWAGKAFDPEDFDPAATNNALHRLCQARFPR